MKKGFFVLIVVAVFVSAQVWAFEGKPMFGVKGGINIANIHGASIKNTDSRTAGVFGGFVEYPIGPTLSFQGEILYSMKGYKATWAESPGEVTREVKATAKLAYLEVPMLLKANLPMGGKTKPQVYAGPAIDFKMSAKHETEGRNPPWTTDPDDVKGTDVGLVMGAGFGFPMGSKMISLEARYDLGLTNIFKKESGEDKEPDVKNNAIAILLGVGF